ncbi:hypothetical protein DXB27_22260 [Parabacteroides gordonii]|nr:hypothetical protein DXB27_22260 [Parabacteroides gordonii]
MPFIRKCFVAYFLKSSIIYYFYITGSHKKRDSPLTYRNNKVINKFLKETTYLLSGKIFFREKTLFLVKTIVFTMVSEG